MIQNFYIHIGTYKTGTTSIQQLLLHYEEQLKLNNVYVIDRERDLPEVSKWLFPQWYDIKDEAKQESKAIHQLLALKESVISYENIIYSEENFTDILCIEEQQARAKKLNFVIEMFSAKSTKAHVFFRDPSTLLLSWYKQLIRNRNYNFSSYQSFIEQNLQNILKACDWKEYTKSLEKSVGKGNIITHKFEDSARHGLTNYFFENILKIKSIKIKEKTYNESQSDLKTRLMESVSTLAINRKLSAKNIGWLKLAIFEMNPMDEAPQEMYKLPKENAAKIQTLSESLNHNLNTKGIKN